MDDRLTRLAELAAHGANVQPGQIVLVGAELGHEDLARAVAAASLLAPPIEQERKGAVSRYYEDIAIVLTEAAQALRQGSVPHGKCGELLSFAHQLPATIGDVIGFEQASALAQKLLECYQVESFGRQFMHLPPTERAAKFGALDEAAGYFRAAARSLQVRR